MGGVATNDVGSPRMEAQGKFKARLESPCRGAPSFEGCRGHLAKGYMDKFQLNKDNQEQIYGIGIKELWQIEPANTVRADRAHCGLAPPDVKTYGGHSYITLLRTTLWP